MKFKIWHQHILLVWGEFETLLKISFGHESHKVKSSMLQLTHKLELKWGSYDHLKSTRHYRYYFWIWNCEFEMELTISKSCKYRIWPLSSEEIQLPNFELGHYNFEIVHLETYTLGISPKPKWVTNNRKLKNALIFFCYFWIIIYEISGQ